MTWTIEDVRKMMAARVGSWTEIVKSLPFDGGPSVTRWVFLRTSEVISLGWLALALVAAFRIYKFGSCDAGVLTLIFTLATALFGFSTLNQNTKLTVDSKGTGSPSTVSTPTGEVTEGTK